MLNFISDLRKDVGTRQLAQFMTILFLWSLVEGMLTFYWPLHIESQMNSIVIVGFLLGVGSLSSLITDLVFGFVSEVSDYRKFLYIGIASYLLVIPLLAFGEGLLPLLVAVIVWGFQYELIIYFGAPLFLAKHSPHGEFAKYGSMSFLIRNIGFFIGPVLADLLRINHLPLLFVLAGALLVAVLAMLYTSFTNHAGVHHRAKVHHLSIISEIKIVKKFLPQMLPFLVLGFGIGVYESIFILFGPIEFARSTDIAGVLSSIVILANIVVPIFAVWAITRFRQQMLVLVSAVLLLLTSIGYTLTTNVILLALMIFIAFGLLALIFLSREESFLRILSHIKVSEEDEAVSVSSLGPNMAYVIVGFLGGMVMQALGFQMMAVVGAVVLLVCVIIFLILNANASGTGRAAPKMH